MIIRPAFIVSSFIDGFPYSFGVYDHVGNFGYICYGIESLEKCKQKAKELGYKLINLSDFEV